MSATAGYWGALQTLWTLPATAQLKQRAHDRWSRARLAASVPFALLRHPNGAVVSWRTRPGAAALAVAALVPAGVAIFAVSLPAHKADRFNERWPQEPEFTRFLVDNTAQALGQAFRGASLFSSYDYAIHLTLANLWVRSVPTISEYGQLVTPQSTYFNHMVLKNDVRGIINGFFPQAGTSWEVFQRVLPMLGARYYIVDDYRDPVTSHLNSLTKEAGYPVVALPQGAHHNAGEAALWNVYELPHPNVGDYSPTEVMTAVSGAAAAELMTKPEFDFTRQAVLSAPPERTLVPARNMRMSLIRGGWHVSGHSDGMSLVILPLQFSHCLRARDRRVRLVRANLMLAGVIFAGDINTDIVFDYGIFTPRCRRGDLSDIKQLQLRIDARAVPLSGDSWLPSWRDAVAKLRAAASAFK